MLKNRYKISFIAWPGGEKIRIVKILILSYFFCFLIFGLEIISSAEDKFPPSIVPRSQDKPIGIAGIPSQEQEDNIYNAKGKRNPFISLVTADGRILKLDSDETAKNLIVNGIIFDKNNISYAIVNDQIVRIGDIIGEYQVLKIEENKVIFIKEGELSEVTIEKEEP